jgi:predicted dehydrogenase
MKKIGLMGCGVVANYGHLPAIQQAARLELFAIFDPNEANLRAAQQKFGVPRAFSDAEKFFASGIEAVTITSPAPLHKNNVMLAAQHGLSVLCEKPLAMDTTEARDMIAAMQQANVPLYTAFCYRFSPSALKIRELVQSGAIGEVRSLRLIYNWDCHGKYTVDGKGQQVIQQRRHERMLEGGPMVDCGPHQIDLAHFWLGSPVVTFEGMGAWADEYEAPDHVWLHMDHANGAHTLVEISYSYGFTAKKRLHEFVYELIGTQGVIRYDREARTFTMETSQGTQAFPWHEEKNFVGLYEEFARALTIGNSALLTSGEEGLRVTEIARQATDQAMAKRFVIV